MGTKSKSDKAKETTLLVLVVDRSGSMQSIKEDMEGGIASLLAEQGKEKGQCLVTLAQFDTEYDLVADGVPVAEVGAVSAGPSGWDGATGRHREDHRPREGPGRPPRKKAGPDHVIVAVVTDGLENSSKEWSHLQVMDSVKARVAEGWDFTFLGANQDAIEEGARVGVAAASSLTYEASEEGTRQAFVGHVELGKSPTSWRVEVHGVHRRRAPTGDRLVT